MPPIPPKQVANLMRYGVTQDFAQKVHARALTVTTIRGTSIKNLVSKYKLSEDEARELKQCVEREPIAPAVMNRLLSRSNFTCCACKGTKGLSFVIHHIVAYEKTQDNTYDNLIVLCPADHDLAHQAGLSLRIPPEQLRKAKAEWEKTVDTMNAGRAVRWDFFRSSDDEALPGALAQGSPESSRSSEMLPRLQAKFPGRIRPEITSVQLFQTRQRCSLEVTTVTRFGVDLKDETMTRTDLAFITLGHGLMFPPEDPVEQNVARFLSDMDEVSIINCTDLFPEEICRQIEHRWRALASTGGDGQGALLADT